MAEWRERGYVPDSDEEDEELYTRHLTGRSHEIIRTLPVSTSAGEKDESSISDIVTKSKIQEIESSGSRSTHKGPEDGKYRKPDSKQAENLSNLKARDEKLEVWGPRGPENHGDKDKDVDASAGKAIDELPGELHRGVESIKNAGQNHHSAFLFDDEGDDDSPLSSLPSSPTEPPSPRVYALPLSLNELHSNSNETLDPNPFHQLVDSVSRPTRSFRPRAEIQLHPYTLEDAKYRSDWRARGLRALRAPANDSYQTQDLQQGDSILAPGQGDSQTLIPTTHDLLFDHSTDNAEEESQSPVTGKRTLHTFDQVSSDEELPDLAAIFGEKTDATPKLPRSSHLKARPPRTRTSVLQQRTENQSYEIPVEDDGLQSKGWLEESGYIVPPSPPHSNAIDSPLQLNGEDIILLDYAASRALPTPVVSSDKSLRKRVIEDSESLSETSSDAGLGNVSRAATISNSSDDDSQGVLQIRRKIKGVLPASWLKIDAKRRKQPRAQRKRHSTQSPEKAADARGLARRMIISSQSHIRERLSLFTNTVISDQDLSEVSGEEAFYEGNRPHVEEDDIQYPIDLATDEVIEEDTIDRMQPSRKSRQSGVSFTTSRQQASKMRSRRSPAKMSSRARHRKKIKRRHPLPQMTVLDAPGLANEATTPRPRYLRVAARRQRNVGNSKSQDPSKKFFQLQTREDTAEINEELVHWRSKVPRKQSNRQQSGGHLPNNDETCSSSNLYSRVDHRHEYPATSQPNFDRQLNSLKISTKQTLQILKSRQIGQGGIEPQPVLNTQSLDGLQLRTIPFLFPHRNRSGRGHFFNQSYSRPAQLENDQAAASRKQTKLPHRVPKPPQEVRKSFRAIQDLAPTALSPAKALPISAPTNTRSADTSVLYPIGYGVPSHPKKGNPTRIKQRQVSSVQNQPQATRASPANATAPSKVSSDLIRLALRCVSSLSSITRHIAFDSSTLIGSHKVADALYLFGSENCDLDLDDRSLTSNQISKSINAVHCDDQCPEDGPVALRCLQEAHNCLTETMHSQSNGLDLLQNQLGRTLKHCLQPLEQVITFVNKRLFSQDVKRRSEFAESALFIIESIIQQLETSLSSTAEERFESHLHIANRLLLHVYQIAKIVDSSELGNELRARAIKIWTDLSGIALSASFRPDRLERVILALEDCDSEDDVATRFNFDASRPEVESIVLVCHLSHLDPSRSWPTLINSILRDKVIQLNCGKSIEALSLAIIVICCICPLARLGIDGESHTAHPQSIIYSGWTLLLPVLNSFLKDYVNDRDEGSKDQQDLGLATLRLFFLLTRDWSWEHSDSLLRNLFNIYAETGMTDLFGTSPMKLPVLVSQDAASVCSLDLEDTDFHIFLRLTALTLLQKQMANAQAIPFNPLSRIKSLVFSLSPNNSRALHQEHSLQKTDLVAMINSYSLYTILYQYSPPGCRPRLAQIENLIEFSHCHLEVCKVALSTWFNICSHAILCYNSEDELTQLAEWMSRMAFESKDKLLGLCGDTSVGLDGKGKIVIESNRRAANLQLICIFEYWSAAVQQCQTESSARNLLCKGNSLGLLLLCKIDTGLEEDAILAIFSLIDAYLDKSPSARENGCLNPMIQDLFRQIIADRLSAPVYPSDKILDALTNLWFKIAHSMVRAMYRTWDDYLLLHGPISFGLLADTNLSRQCEVLFLAKIISADPLFFDLDQYYVYSQWIKCLLQPAISLRFEHLLSNEILKFEETTLSLPLLREKLGEGDGPVFLQLSDLTWHRLEIIKHLIRNIYNVQYQAADDLDDGLTKTQGAMLLRDITNQMKSTWRVLKNESRDDWTDFIHKVLFEMGIYPFTLFSIDPWFTDPHELEFPKRSYMLEEIFVSQPGPKVRELDEVTISMFRRYNEAALIQGFQNQWGADLCRVFCPIDLSLIGKDGSLTYDIPLLTTFIQTVFPVYFETAFLAPTCFLATPLLRACCHLFSNLHLRIDNNALENLEDTAGMIHVLLHSLCEAFTKTDVTLVLEKNQHQLALNVVLAYELIAKAVQRYVLIQDYCPSSHRIMFVRENIQANARYLYGLLSHMMAPYGLQKLVDDEIDDGYDDNDKLGTAESDMPRRPDLSIDSQRLTSTARRDLEHAMKSNWQTIGTDGNEGEWLVHHGRSSALIRHPAREEGAFNLRFSIAVMAMQESMRALGLMEELLVSEGLADLIS